MQGCQKCGPQHNFICQERLYFVGQTMQPVTRKGRLGSYRYMKERRRASSEDSKCSGSGQVHRDTGKLDLNASMSGKSEEISENVK